MSKFKWFMFLLVGLVWSHTSFAATCSVQASSIPFASYLTLDTVSKTVSSSFSVSCQPDILDLITGVVVQVGLSRGNGKESNRYMSNGKDKLYYNVYKDAGFQTIFGQGHGGNGAPVSLCLDSVVCGTSSTNTPGTSLGLHMYGAIPPKQDVSPGTYSDSLILQLVF